MAKQLTDRQKQIKRLLDQKKTPREVADALGITENAVYQMRRRMKPTKAAAANGAKPAKAPARKPAAKAATRAPARKRATPRQPAIRATNPPLLAGTVKPTSPLEAIAQRRKVIEAQLQATAKTLDEAVRAQEVAEKAHTEALAKVEPELEQLKVAEGVLTGKIRSAPRRKVAGSRSNGKAKAPAATPETVGGGAATLAAHVTGTTPEGAAADAERAAAELELAKAQAAAARPPAPVEHEVNAPSPVVPDEEERPGVPTLAEFEQPEVEFVE